MRPGEEAQAALAFVEAGSDARGGAASALPAAETPSTRPGWEKCSLGLLADLEQIAPILDEMDEVDEEA